MAKRLTEKQKKIIINCFSSGKSIEDLSKEFKCTNSTIIRNLKKELGEQTYKEVAKKIKTSIQNNNKYEKDSHTNNLISILLYFELHF